MSAANERIPKVLEAVRGVTATWELGRFGSGGVKLRCTVHVAARAPLSEFRFPISDFRIPTSAFRLRHACVAETSAHHPVPLKLSVKSDYATRAVLSLARRFDSRDAVRVEEIARENNVPPNYLVQILIELKTSKIVKSIRGKAGGYLLARPPAQITFADVLLCVHGPLFDTPALTDDACPPQLRDSWRRLRQAIETEAAGINFRQLVEANPDPARMFYI